MESEISDTMKEKQDNSFEHLSLMNVKIEPEDGDTKDTDNGEHSVERDVDDGEVLKEPLSLLIKSEPGLERVSEETIIEENVDVAENTEGMVSSNYTMKRENVDEEALLEPVFVPVNVNFKGISEKIKEEIIEETKSTEGSNNRISKWPHMECSFQITASTSALLSDEAVGMSSEEHLSKNCFSSEIQCEMPFAVASCSIADDSVGQEGATWGYLSEEQEGEQGVRQRQHSHQSESGGGRSVDVNLLEGGVQTSASIKSSSKESERECWITVYECCICKEQFAWKYHLARHMRIHTGERPYGCRQCQKCFNRNCDLTVHMRTHTGERPYKCSQCEKSFRQRSTLIKHKRTHTHR